MIGISPSIFLGIILGGALAGALFVGILALLFLAPDDGYSYFMGRRAIDPLAEPLKRALRVKKRLSPDKFQARVNRVSLEVRHGLAVYIAERIKVEKSPALRQQMEDLNVALMAVKAGQ